MPENFYAPGRIEISGNHTDHQHGCVLAAAINLRIECSAQANGSDIVRIASEGFPTIEIGISDLAPRKDELGTSAALIRGVTAWFQTHSKRFGGFDGQMTSNIPIGIGLSSSAAFEVLIGRILQGLFHADVTPWDIAYAGQFAENEYFGKPSGLMDQAASSIGGMCMFDFFDANNPTVLSLQPDFGNYTICIVDTGDSHEDLTYDYAAIPDEMKSIAGYFGKGFLRDVAYEEFISSIDKLRHLGDRSILRALHFFNENSRVQKQAKALESGDLRGFINMVKESGRSSLAYLQNIYRPEYPQNQSLTLALAICETVLGIDGGYRVHGGGFAGTVLAFVPPASRYIFESKMTSVFGEGCCHFLSICV